MRRDQRTSHTTVTLEDVTLFVAYVYSPASRGERDSLNGVAGAGARLEPDEPQSVELLTTTTTDDMLELLSSALQERVQAAILKQLADAREDEP